MRKNIMSYGLWVMGFVFITHLASPITIFAQEASPSATKQASPSATTNSIIEKVNELKKQIASKAALFKNDVSKKMENKAWIGTITEKTDSKLTLQSKNGSKNIIVNEFTLFENQSGVKTKKGVFGLVNLENNDSLIALGDVDDKNFLTAKKIVKIDPLKNNQTQFFWGQIIKLNGNILTIKNSKSEEIELLTTNNTEFSLGTEEASLLDAKLDKFIAGWGTLPKDYKRISTNFIYILTRGGKIKPQTATSSALAK